MQSKQDILRQMQSLFVKYLVACGKFTERERLETVALYLADNPESMEELMDYIEKENPTETLILEKMLTLPR